MRHLYANAVTWALAAGLVLFVALWAWARSAQLVIASETDVEPAWARGAPDAGGVDGPDMAAFGEAVYVANCRNCHVADGSGRGMYPPVRNLAAHLDAEGGRGYLIDLTLYGLHTGEYGAPMPPMPELSDAEIAAATNHVLVAFAADVRAPAPGRLYAPAEVAARRGRELDEGEVARMRPAIPSVEALGAGADDGGS